MPGAPVRVQVRNLGPSTLGSVVEGARPRILLSPRALGIKERVQCVLIHEYGHLAGRGHSRRPSSIMYYRLNPRTCHRWLVRHHVG